MLGAADAIAAALNRGRTTTAADAVTALTDLIMGLPADVLSPIPG